MPGSGDLELILGLGCGVIAIFAVIFLFYTNSFLMKRRKKEFGLFNILGMEKRHIGKMMFWESIMVACTSIFLGVAAGLLLNKLVTMVLLRLVKLEVAARHFLNSFIPGNSPHNVVHGAGSYDRQNIRQIQPCIFL